MQTPRLMKRISILILLAIVTLGIKAQDQLNKFNPVEYTVPSLAIAPDARAGAMGDVGAGTDPDVYSQYWNPAKYAFTVSKAGVCASYTPWLRRLVSDIDLANVTGYWRFSKHDAISASLRYFSLGEVIAPGEITVKPYEMAIDVAYSRLLSETFSAGVAMRYIRSDMGWHEQGTTPGNAFAADLSMFHLGYFNMGSRECQMGWGINISNIGTKISYDGGNTSMFIPTNLRIGMSIMIPINEFNTISVSADANKLLVPTKPTFEQYKDKNPYERTPEELEQDYSGYRTWLEGEGYYNISPITGIFKSFADAPGGFKEEMEEITISAGLEYSYNNRFFVRAGYHHEAENKGNRKYFTVGAAFKMSVFQIDAAYVIATTQSNPLDQTMKFSLAFDMDGIKDLIGKRKR